MESIGSTIQWQLIFDGNNNFCFQAKTEDPPKNKTQRSNVLIDVPGEIVQRNIFFGLDRTPGKPGGTYNANLLCYALAEKLSLQSFEQRFEWTNWVSDIYQSAKAADGNYEWLSLENIGTHITTSVDRPNFYFALSYIFWKGLFIYFNRNDRWREMQSRFLYLLSAWQWFHFSRKLADSLLPNGAEKRKESTQNTYLEHWINNDLVEATHTLQRIIGDPENDFAIQLLLWYGRGGKSKNDLGAAFELYDGSESLFLGMVLDDEDASVPASQMVEKLILPDLHWTRSDIRFIKKNRAMTGIEWETSRLHPVFFDKTQYNLRSFARSLISRWLLPHYDFEGALNLAFRLKNNDSTGEKRPVTYHRILSGLWIWVAALAVSMTILGQWISPTSVHSRCLMIGACFFEFLLVLAPPLLLLLTSIERSVYQYLLLPRLLGGMAVGYSALVLQGDSIKIVEMLFSDGWGMGLILWGVLLLLTLVPGFWYLYYECYAIVGDETIAKKRAKQVFSVALLSSAFMGLFAVALSTGMRWQGANPLANQWFLLGPIGWIDLRQYLVFVPLALLTGFITQFIFEEKSITASIWQEK